VSRSEHENLFDLVLQLTAAMQRVNQRLDALDDKLLRVLRDRTGPAASPQPLAGDDARKSDRAAASSVTTGLGRTG
jgi:hypothetical protein